MFRYSYFIGVHTATKANVRTAVAANDKGPAEALNVAFLVGQSWD